MLYSSKDLKKDQNFLKELDTIRQEIDTMKQEFAILKRKINRPHGTNQEEEMMDEGATGGIAVAYESNVEVVPTNVSLNEEKLLQDMMTSFKRNHAIVKDSDFEYFKENTGCEPKCFKDGSIILQVECPSVEKLVGFWKGCTDGTVVKAMSKIRDAYRRYLRNDKLEFEIDLKMEEVTRRRNQIIEDWKANFKQFKEQMTDLNGRISRPETNQEEEMIDEGATGGIAVAQRMMATSVIGDILTNADKVNWIKGVLVMEITDEAIRPFVETEITKFHYDIRSNFRHGYICGKCRSTNANYCLSRICSGITSQIESVHRYSPPCYKNSDITKWLSDPWEIAKCYMSRSKDLEGKPVSDIDFPSVLNVVINNTRFQRLITAVDMTNNNNIFCKGRNARNEVMHSRKHQMTVHDLKNFCDIFIDIVNQIGTDKADCERKIKKVRDTPLSITEEDIVNLKEQAARYQGLSEVAIEELKKKWREEIKKVTGESLIPSFIEGCKKSLCILTIEHIQRLKPERTSKNDWTVEKFLERLELQAETKDLSERHREMLFPSSGSPLDIEQWDIYLYCLVLRIELHQRLDSMTLLFMKDAKLIRDNLLANPFGVDKSQLSNLYDNTLKDDILMIFERERTVADMMHANSVLQSWKKEEEIEGEARYKRNQAEKDKLIFQMMQDFSARLSQVEKNNGSARTESDEGAKGRANESFGTKAELKCMNASPADIEKLQKIMMSPYQNNHVLQNTGANELFGNLTKGCSIDGIANGSIILKVGCPSIESLFAFWEGCTDGTVVKAMSKIRDAYRKHLGCDTLEFDIVLKKKEVIRCTNMIIGDLNSRLERLETQAADVDEHISEPDDVKPLWIDEEIETKISDDVKPSWIDEEIELKISDGRSDQENLDAIEQVMWIDEEAGRSNSENLSLPMKYDGYGEEEASRFVKLLRQISERLGGGNISTVNPYIRDILHNAKERTEEFHTSIYDFTKMVDFKGGISTNLMKQAIRGFDMIKEQPQFGDLVTSKLDDIEKEISEQIVKGTTRSQETPRFEHSAVKTSVSIAEYTEMDESERPRPQAMNFFGTPITKPSEKGVKSSMVSDPDDASFKHLVKERNVYMKPLGPTKLTNEETDALMKKRMPTSPLSSHQSLTKGTEEQTIQNPLRPEESKS